MIHGTATVNQELRTRKDKYKTLYPLLSSRQIPLTRVARGGNFRSNPDVDGNDLRLAFRHSFLPDSTLRRLGIRCVRADVDDPLWLQSRSLNGFPNWFFLDWFGYYWQSSNNWVFHYELGWLYPKGKGSYDNWIFFPKHGWMWTGRYVYPNFYSNKESTWYLYDHNSKDFGWFKNLVTNSRFRFGRKYP